MASDTNPDRLKTSSLTPGRDTIGPLTDGLSSRNDGFSDHPTTGLSDHPTGGGAGGGDGGGAGGGAAAPTQQSGTTANTQSHVRGLQRVWVPEHSLWVFVWCADDGDLDRNHRMAYACVGSPAEFYPQQGQFILVSKPGTTYNYVYGVPYAIESVNGAVKVHYGDLTPALGWPRWTSDSPTPASAPKNRDAGAAGSLLEGQFAQEGLATTGPILWNAKGQALHNNPLPLIEIADVTNVIGVGGASRNQYGAPSGAMMVEHVRDNRGRIQTNSDGSEQIAQIDSGLSDKRIVHSGGAGVSSYNRSSTAQYYKIGYLALTFRENFFGVGLHGWVAGATDATNPYQPGSLGYASNTADPTVNTHGPWGGSTDTLSRAGTSDPKLPRKDSWHHRRPPLDSRGKQTDGCILTLERTYIDDSSGSSGSSGSGAVYRFRREPSVDRFGFVFALSGETLVESSSDGSSGSSGSGGGSGGGSSGGSSGGSGGGSSGSEKSSNAIVPLASRQAGFAALATIESNQVLLEFVLRNVVITGRETRVAILPDWVAVCEPGTLMVCGAPCAATPHIVGAWVSGGEVILTAARLPWNRPQSVTFKLTGIRKGFSSWDMPDRTQLQFTQNEESIQGMYQR